MRKVVLIPVLFAMTIATVANSQETAPSAKAKPSAGRMAPQPAVKPDTPMEQPADSVASPSAGALLPVGTTVRMKLETMLSTVTTKPNADFAGRVTEPVMLDGKTIIPVGASVTGHVLRVDEPRRIKGAPMINLRPESVTMPNGDQFAMAAVIVDTSNPKAIHVDQEGRMKGSGHDKEDVVVGGAGVGAGALIGAKFGGVHGAVIGATVGGGAAFVRWMSRRHSETIPAGTELFMELSRPMQMSMSGANGR